MFGSSSSLSAVPIEIEDLGRAAYAPTLEHMRALHARVANGEDAGRILIVEHDPVYTAGRATPAHELVPQAVPIERGGKITYHGPGQLVVYPILPLPVRDVREWLQRLERFGVSVCSAFGLEAKASVDGTGVFVGAHKVASIGVAIKRWTNLHGIAINVAMDNAPWFAVRPCGRAPETMSDLSTALGRAITLDEARVAVRERAGILTDPRRSS
jgi:lipoyl(octanoyl) transferase